MDVAHDIVELFVDFFASPAQADGVLGHFKPARGHAAGVGSLAGSVEDAGFHVDFDCLGSGGHIRAFGDAYAAVFDEGFGVFAVDFVLGRRGESDFGLDEAPRTLAFVVLGGRELFDVFAHAAPLDVFELHYIGELFGVESVGVDYRAVGVGHRKGFGAELHELFNGVLGDVAGTGDENIFALKGIALGGEHFLREIDVAVARGFGEAAAPFETLAGQDAVVGVFAALVLAEEVSDFAAAHADVARGNVGVGTDVAVEFAHERIAEIADFVVALALGVEI